MTRVAFYSPMTEPDAAAASGAERMGALLQRALAAAGFDVMRPRLPCTFDGKGDAARQQSAKIAAQAAALEWLQKFRAGAINPPDLWFSYHVYYKSPDWIGPEIARGLGIPYVIAEGSHAPKRTGGPWALGHEGATLALKAADALLAMTAFDRVCLDQIAPGRVRDLKPFIDVAPFASLPRPEPSDQLRLVTVGMMRNERKLASYALLADALRLMTDVPLTLTIAGDGRYRSEVEAKFAGITNVRFLGAVAAERVPALLGASDIFAWPGLGEAYGLVFLEAQAAGLPVVACRDRGVPDVTCDGVTSLQSAPGDARAYATNLRRLATDSELRVRLGANGRGFVHGERSVEAAAAQMRRVLGELLA
jgi:glycosyltransferase involved in cell wall biosynthesis